VHSTSVGGQARDRIRHSGKLRNYAKMPGATSAAMNLAGPCRDRGQRTRAPNRLPDFPAAQTPRICLKSLIYRLIIGLTGLTAFWTLGMLSANELAKSGVLMTVSMLGLAGVSIIQRPNRAWISRISLAVYLLFFVDAAVKGFLRGYFGMRPNPSLVLQAALNTSGGETQEFFLHNWRGIGQALLVFFVLSCCAIVAERRLSRLQRSAPVLATSRSAHATVAAMLTLFVALHFNPTMAKENPVLLWPIRYLDYQQQLDHAASLQKNQAAQMTQRADWQVRYDGAPDNTVVWVIGESINRTNLSLYGYARATTPGLDALRGELLVFNDVVSSEAATMNSLMNMLTPANLDQPHVWSQQPNILMLAQEAGYKTFWISNHAPNDGWLGLVSGQASNSTFINKGVGRGENNIDGNLLPHVGAALADRARKKLIVVHLLGAHPSYDMRYPDTFSQFDAVDDAVSASMKAAGRSIWIRHKRNQYDNAILYGDHVLASLIEMTRKASAGSSAALLFSADHGQEVGHTRNHAGHSAADKSGYEIPMLVWDSAPEPSPSIEKSALENRPYQTDHLDHTLLGLLDISTRYYAATNDVLNDLFRPSARSINGVHYLPEAGSDPSHGTLLTP
jgi:heptose-I-phosphate ethanolaminephosphotransferase